MAPPSYLIKQTASLEMSMARPLALHMHYFDWATLATISDNGGEPTIADDIAHNRVPVISWHCKDNYLNHNYDLAQIAAGDARSDLLKIGQELSQLKTPDGSTYPIMLRYFWEFNINSVDGDPLDINGNNGCFSPNATTAQQEAEFIGAWQAIYTTLQGLLPHPNVSMDWNPNVTGGASIAGPYLGFYPGPSYVDWIGFDGYDKEDPNNNYVPLGFPNVFQADLTAVATDATDYGLKPMIIAETGSCDQYTSPYTQPQYLSSSIGIQQTLESNVAPWTSVKAIMYFDAPGHYNPPQSPPSTCTYTLNSGLTQWNTLSAQPYFQATVAIP